MVAVLGQAGEAPRPAVGLADRLGLDDVAVGEQVHGDGLGTLAVLVVLVIPRLRSGNLDGLGDGRIGDAIAVDLRRVVAGHLILGNRVDDCGALVAVLRQAGEAPGPAFVLGDGLGIDLRAVCEQVHGNARRALAVLVVAVVPGLGALDVDGLGGVPVRNGEAVDGVAFDRIGRVTLVNAHRILGHGVGDELTALVLIEVRERPAPRRIRAAELDVLRVNLGAVLVQAHGDRFGALAVAVAVIGPDLRAGHARLLGGVLVRDGEAAGSIACNGIGRVAGNVYRLFGHGVGDELAALILRQIGERPRPRRSGVATGYGRRLVLLAVLEQVHDDRRGALAVLVVRVVPNLRALDVDRLGDVGVRHIVAVDLGGVALDVDRILGNRVNDLDALVAVLRQTREAPRPAVGCLHVLRCNFLAVGPQAHGDALRTLAVLVVRIVPGLGTGDGNLLGNVGVLQVHAVRNGRVTLNAHGDFLDRVDDFNTLVAVFRQILERVVPRIGGVVAGHGLGIDLGAIGEQVHSNARRAQAVLIMGVVPRLFARHARRLGDVLVLDIGTGDGRRVAVNRLLLDRIDDLRTVLALRLVLERVAPVSVRVGLHGLRRDPGAVGQQVHGNARRAQAILVVLVGPGLGTGHVDVNGLVGVREVVAVLIGRVVGYRILGHGVDDLDAVFVLRQAGEAVRPLASCVGRIGRDNLGSLLDAVGVQAHGDVRRTLAVLVVGIGPGLGTGDADVLGRAGVRDDIAVLTQRGASRGVIGNHGNLFDAIGDLRTVDALGQLRPFIGPGVGGCQVDFRLHVFDGNGRTVHSREQAHGDLRRTQAFLAVLVAFPFLCDLQGGLLGQVHVVQHELAVFFARCQLEVGGHDLVDRVDDFGAVLIFGQVGERVLPALGRLQVVGGDNLVAFLHLGRDERRLHAVHAAGGDPVLLHVDRRDLGRMRIGDGGLAFNARVVGGRVARGHRAFLYTIYNVSAILHRGQVVPLNRPVVLLAQRNRIAVLLAVGQQHHGCRGRIVAQTVLIVRIIPDLAHGVAHRHRRMRVGDGIVIDVGGITAHFVFGDRVDDIVAVIVLLVQVFELVGPLVGIGIVSRSGHGDMVDLHTVGPQAHGDGLGTQAILVICVVPGLRAFDFDLFFRRVRDREHDGAAVFHGRARDDEIREGISVDGRLDRAVLNLHIIGVRIVKCCGHGQRQAVEDAFPIGGRIQRDALLHIAPNPCAVDFRFLADAERPVCIGSADDPLLQHHGDVVVAVLVVAVGPFLEHLHIGARIVLHGHRVAIMVNVLRVVGRAVLGDHEAIVKPGQLVAFGRLGLVQVIALVLVDGPTQHALVAAHYQQAVIARRKRDWLAPLIDHRLLTRIEQLELGARQALRHIAAFVLHHLDRVDRSLARAIVRAMGRLVDLAGIAVHLGHIVELDVLGFARVAVVVEHDARPVCDDNWRLIGNLIRDHVA